MADSSSRVNARTPIFEEVKSGMPTEPFPPPEMPSNPVAAGPKRTKRAKDYELKATDFLNTAMRALASSEATVPDAAAVITHGDIFAAKLGDLADADPRVRRAVDWITAGTENPYVAVVAAALPLVAQVVRNHEVDNTVRVGIRIPFTKRTIRIPFKMKLNNKILRGLTRRPQDITDAVFQNPEIKHALLAARVEVAYPGYRMETPAE